MSLLIDHVQLAAEVSLPSWRQVNHEREVPVAIVIRMGTKEVSLDHRVRAEIVAPTKRRSDVVGRTP